MTPPTALQKISNPDISSTPTAKWTFAGMIEEIRTRRQEFDRLRHVPKDIVAQFKTAGIYRAATPKSMGGDAISPASFLRLIEQIGEADGSAGWVASFGSAGVYLAALPEPTLKKLYADGPDIVFAGGLFPIQPAKPVDGGYQVSGTWKWASGCMGADYLGVGIGASGAGPNGAKPRTAVFHPSQVEIVDNWDVIGLRGTGSHDLRVHDKFVAEEWTFIRGGQPTVDEPLYRYPTIAYAAQVLAVVNLGVARAALDEISLVSGGKTGATGAPKLADRAYFRIDVAKAEAKLRSARTYFYDVTETVWESILAGNVVTPEQTSQLRLAAVEASRVSTEVVCDAFRLAGTSAIDNKHPMQRYLRDALVISQHAFLGEGLYDAAGAVTLGVPPMPGYI